MKESQKIEAKSSGRIRIHIFEIIGYLSFLILLGVMWFVLQMQNNMMFFVVTLCSLLPLVSVIVSIITLRIITRKGFVSLIPAEAMVEREQAVDIAVVLKNPCFWLIRGVELGLHVQNPYFENDDTHILDIGAVGIKDQRYMHFPLRPVHCGIVDVRGRFVRFSDWLGFVTYTVPMDEGAFSIYVMPKHIQEIMPELEDSRGGSDDDEDLTQQRGYTSNEILEIRSYIPGDRLQSIHWKLTAKAGELMVKEYENLSADHYQLMPQLAAPDADQFDETMELFFSLCYELIHEQGQFFSIYYWSVGQGKILSYPVYEEADLDVFFKQLFQEKLPDKGEAACAGMELSYYQKKGAGRNGYLVYVTPAQIADGEELFCYRGRIRIYQILV